MSEPRYPLTIYYDGACRVCSDEMEHYRGKNRQGHLLFVDISAPEFRPLEHGLTLEALMARMHVRDGAGRFFTGIEAFQVIWRACPEPWLHWAARILGLPGIKQCAQLGYALFARFRYLLPKKQCADGVCSRSPHTPD